MKKIITVSLATVALLSTPAMAKGMIAGRFMGNGTGCGMNETAQVNITLNGTEQDVTAIKTKFETKQKEIETLVKDAGLDKFDLQSMNYSINPQMYGSATSSYMFNGNVSYSILPASKAVDLMAALIKKGYQASVNVNAYRNGNMPCPPTPTPAPAGQLQSE